MTTMTALPEPTRSDRERRINYTWDIGTITDKLDGDGTIQACLSIGHNRDRKYFYATLSQQTAFNRNGFTVTSFMLFDGLGISREPVARYSAKRLDEFAAKALAKVRELYGEDERVDRYFVPKGES